MHSKYATIAASFFNTISIHLQLYIILNVAAGGGGFSARCKNGKNGIGGRRPWNTSLPLERKQFWDARAEWLPTWDNCKTDKPAMKVDWVRVYELDTN